MRFFILRGLLDSSKRAKAVPKAVLGRYLETVSQLLADQGVIFLFSRPTDGEMPLPGRNIKHSPLETLLIKALIIYSKFINLHDEIRAICRSRETEITDNYCKQLTCFCVVKSH